MTANCFKKTVSDK